MENWNHLFVQDNLCKDTKIKFTDKKKGVFLVEYLPPSIVPHVETHVQQLVLDVLGGHYGVDARKVTAYSPVIAVGLARDK